MTVKINNGTSAHHLGHHGRQPNRRNAEVRLSQTAANVVTFQNGINLNAANRTINVDDNPATGADYAAISGVISYGSGTAGIIKTGSGVLLLSGANTYNGTTTISGGAIAGGHRHGHPHRRVSSASTAAPIRATAPTPSTAAWAPAAARSSGPPTAAASPPAPAPLTVNIGSGTALTWGTTVGTNIVGTLKFGSATAANVTTFQNAINLNGATRTIQVDDNPSTTADYAVISGVISNGTGTAGIIKTGTGLLSLTGADTYNGSTTISGGLLKADQGVGLAVEQSCSSSTAAFCRATRPPPSPAAWAPAAAPSSGRPTAAVSPPAPAPLTVNIGNGTALSWGTTLGTNIEGTLKLNSLTAANVLTFQNAVNLNGGARTIQVDSPNQPAASLGSNYAVMSGVLSDSAGGASLTKTGAGVLSLTGSSGNTYSGLTTVTGGGLYLGQDVRLRRSRQSDAFRKHPVLDHLPGKQRDRSHLHGDLERHRCMAGTPTDGS